MPGGASRSKGRCVRTTRSARASRGSLLHLHGREVAARGPVVAAVLERRLGEEQVGVAGQFRDRLGRAAVARVGEDAVALDPEAEGLDVVVVDRHRGHLEPGRRGERHPRLVLGHVERPVEHVLAPQHRQDGPELVAGAGRKPELRLRQRLAGTVEAAPHPGDEVAPVVEVQVRDRDRLDGRPGLSLTQTWRALRGRNRAAGGPRRGSPNRPRRGWARQATSR